MCYRSDGPIADKIFLPIDKPFYLMRYTSGCQQVYGMVVREEYFQFDDENTNNRDSCSGAHPYDTGCNNDHMLYFCYYEVDRQNSAVFGWSCVHILQTPITRQYRYLLKFNFIESLLQFYIGLDIYFSNICFCFHNTHIKWRRKLNLCHVP